MLVIFPSRVSLQVNMILSDSNKREKKYRAFSAIKGFCHCKYSLELH
jgi:hypothetical protein